MDLNVTRTNENGLRAREFVGSGGASDAGAADFLPASRSPNFGTVTGRADVAAVIQIASL